MSDGVSRTTDRKTRKRRKKAIRKERWQSRSLPNKILTIIWRIIAAAAVLYGAMVLAMTLFMHSKPYRRLANEAYDTLARMSDGTFRLLSNTKFLDTDGKLIGEVNSGNYVYAPIDQIPKELQDAYVAIEDKNYKIHQGVDYKAIARATWELIRNKGEITQGGSTITQQVIKNNLLTSEQTFTRKFTEILIAPQLEKKYNKAEIMEFYCNSNYYGNGCYGVQSAAKFYFNKNIRELTLGECAMVAGISNSPNRFNPVADYDLAVKKMKKVLYQMYDQGYITEKEYKDAASAEIIVTQSETSLVSSNNYMCSFAMHYSTLELMKLDGFKLRYAFKDQDDYEKYRKNYEKKYSSMASKIREGGYTIKTSFDQEAQKILQNTINETLSGSVEKTDDGNFILQSAAVCVNNDTGMVVAAVGGRGDSYNRAFLAERQPGSSIKPLLVYTPSIEAGASNPSSIVTDKQVFAVPGDTSSYSPKNANNSYLGDMTVREAVARSTNTVAFQLYNADYISYLEKLRFSSIVPADYTAASLCLGGFTYGVTVADMAHGYTTLANYGISSEKSCLLTITHEKEGKVYDAAKVKPKKIYSSDAAFMMTDILQGVFMEGYGTCYGTGVDGQFVAGKTGTTNSNHDAWLCGYTPYYTTAVWVGREDNAVLNDGSIYSKSIFIDYMNAIHCGLEERDFKVPDSLQYRKVIGGEYTLQLYNKANLNMKKRSYLRRPKGYEYYSKAIEDNKNDKSNNGNKADFAEAKKAVAEFEKYKITNVETALGLDSAYSKAFKLVEALPDGKKKSELLDRLQQHYELLEKAFKKDWQKLIAEQEKDEIKKAQKQSAVDAENSQLEAQTRLHDHRIALLDWYLKTLNSRQYNTSVTQQILSDAKQALTNCSTYDEYDDYAVKLSDAEERLDALPTSVPSLQENAADQQRTYPNENTSNE